ncbi:MAG: HAMP domain-containing protein, partial [Acidobacteria bacterium]|nr:HAMP domain-containing protein [Acidobacteriota bacterium]
MTLFNTFRGRLLVILSLLLIATLGLQFYLNYNAQQENIALRDAQSQALLAGIALGSNGITSGEYMQELLDRGQTFFDESAAERVKDVIIIDNKWQVFDSLNPDYLPVTGEDGTTIYRKLSELTDLPPLMEGAKLGTDLANFPNRDSIVPGAKGDEALAIPIETSRGRWYVMVLLHDDHQGATWRAASPLIYTLGLLLISAVTTFVLVWRFARPIANISNAAREVAAGNLGVRVPDTDREDEMGQLSQRFNEMTANLEKTRELEDQLRQAEKSAVIGRLGSAIAHEIRNPLNYINLTLDHLRSKFAPVEPDKSETFARLVSQIKTEVGRINRQISDFLS